LKRLLKWLGYGLASILLLILLVFIIANIYVQQHKTELITEASRAIQKKYHSRVYIKDIH